MPKLEQLPGNLNQQTVYAHVQGKQILHAGKIIGWHNVRGQVLLSSAGLRGYAYFSRWVPMDQLKPLEGLYGYTRHADTQTAGSKRNLMQQAIQNMRRGRHPFSS